MKKLFLGSVALLALGLGTTAGLAAELRRPPPPPPPAPVYTLERLLCRCERR